MNPTNSPELPLARPAKDAQGVHDAEQLVAREDSNAGKSPRRDESGVTGHDDDEEEDKMEEDPLEWAYSMTHVPKIEVLVMCEVKCTVEANRQDDTQSGVLVPMKKARESGVVQSG